MLNKKYFFKGNKKKLSELLDFVATFLYLAVSVIWVFGLHWQLSKKGEFEDFFFQLWGLLTMLVVIRFILSGSKRKEEVSALEEVN